MPNNRRNRPAIAVLAALIAVVLLFAVGCGKPPADNIGQAKLVVNVIDVGQGDAILIRTPGQQVTLVDTGDVPARDKLVAYLKRQGITAIDNLIITHPHADHLGGAAAILEEFPVKHVYDSGQTTTHALLRQYLTAVKNKHIPFTVVSAGQQIDLGGGVLFKIYGPPAKFIIGSDSDLNNNSIVGRLVYGSFAMLLPGDAEQEAEDVIAGQYGPELKSQVLKSPHHGSRTSSSPEFLKAVAPEAAIISVGAHNDYHHPHPSTLKRYESLNINVFRTDQSGTVTVTSDGKTYTITKEK